VSPRSRVRASRSPASPWASRRPSSPRAWRGRGSAGKQGTTAIETVTAVAIRARKPVGYETKRQGPLRRWQVIVLGVDDAPVVTFRLAKEAEATELAARVGEAIGRPVRETGRESR
jgi:hypothetical protein